MAWFSRARATSLRRTDRYAIGAAAALLLVVAGMVFAGSATVTGAAGAARDLHWTNETMGASAMVTAGLVQAVTSGELRDIGLVDRDEFDFAMDQLDSAVVELQHLYDTGETRASYPDLARFVGAIDAAIDDLASGDVAVARARMNTDVESLYGELMNSLASEREAIQQALDESSEASRNLSTWVVVILTLAVPGAAVAVYFFVVRRQVRALKERNEIELEAERTTSRAKDAFIVGVSHALRTPLTSIYGFAEMLAEGEMTGLESTSETARIIANEAMEMTRMVDDLLTASRLESTGVEVELARTGVQGVIDAAVESFEKNGIQIERERSLAVAMTDAARLRHVLVNLLSNAVCHGGPRVGVHVTEGDGVVEIEVWDNGDGGFEERIDSLFDHFASESGASLLTRGAGLGLAVASRLSRLVGGRLEYQRFGGKTYFVVTLPTAELAEDEADDDSVAAMIRSLSS
ncbi:MAG TPA: HAMP domain-containing sensor histidine kinase [Acidimicrobiia bacterium]|nr:HAMP domain-containing sensor histidine kinase [Acidimicrobiia bacterium]